MTDERKPLEAAHRWLDKFARHVGCLGADKCECGLTPLMIQMDKTLRQADTQTPPRTGSPEE